MSIAHTQASWRRAALRRAGFAAALIALLAATQVALAQLHAIELGFALVVQSYLALLGVIVLTALGWWRQVGYLKRPDLRQVRLFAPAYVIPVIVVAGILMAGPTVREPSLILVGALVYLVGAFGEEALFRGAILQAFLPRGLLRAAIASSVFFGLQHLGSLAAGLPVRDTLIQMLIVAPVLGFGFAALRIRSGAIWPLMVLHALVNFGTYLAQGGVLNAGAASIPNRLVWAAPLALLEMLVLPIYGVWLLRKSSRSKVGSFALGRSVE